MGLLSLGTPLDWEECKKFSDHVRQHGILQFIHLWKKMSYREDDELLWGDEVNKGEKKINCIRFSNHL
jgi:glutamate--cysteine ligase catalytic subunit